MTEETGSHPTRPAPRAWLDVRGARPGAVVALVVVIACVLWLVFRGGSDSDSGSPVPRGAKAVRISVKGLKTLAAFGIPIYWAGQRPSTTYELTKTADNRAFIRYLPAGVPIGSGKRYLTIGTYPVSHAFLVTSRLAASSGTAPVEIGKDGVAFSKSPESVFLARRGSGVQIEVYDPTPGRARDLVTSHQVTAVRPR